MAKQSLKKKVLIFGIIFYYLLFFSSPAQANPLIDSKATSPIPIEDDRIAKLRVSNPPTGEHFNNEYKTTCTASYLGKGIWITALHCIPATKNLDAYLHQSDGDHAKVEAIYSLSPSDDIALLQTGEGINAQPFDLPSRPLERGERANLTGYGAVNGFSSTAIVEIVDYLASQNFGSALYTNLIKSKSVTSSRSCDGDSGAPIYRENTIYALHTAGGFNPSCIDGQGQMMWHTDLFLRVDWIKSTIEKIEKNSLNEKKAFQPFANSSMEISWGSSHFPSSN